MTESDPRRRALHDDTSPQEGDGKGGLLAKIPKRAKSDCKAQTAWHLRFHSPPSIFRQLVPAWWAGRRKMKGEK